MWSPGSPQQPFVDHTFYTTVNMIRTLEVLLALQRARFVVGARTRPITIATAMSVAPGAPALPLPPVRGQRLPLLRPSRALP